MIANMKNKTVFLSRRLFVSAVFSAGAVFAREEVHSFYISNHDQSPSHRVIHPIVGKTNFVYDAKGALELVKGEAIAFLVRDCENVTFLPVGASETPLKTPITSAPPRSATTSCATTARAERFSRHPNLFSWNRTSSTR